MKDFATELFKFQGVVSKIFCIRTVQISRGCERNIFHRKLSLVTIRCEIIAASSIGGGVKRWQKICHISLIKKEFKVLVPTELSTTLLTQHFFSISLVIQVIKGLELLNPFLLEVSPHA